MLMPIHACCCRYGHADMRAYTRFVQHDSDGDDDDDDEDEMDGDPLLGGRGWGGGNDGGRRNGGGAGVSGLPSVSVNWKRAWRSIFKVI